MNNTQNKESILLVMKEPGLIETALYEALSGMEIHIFTAATGVDGLSVYKDHLPCLVLVDNKLQDMMGMSFSAILKDSMDGGTHCSVYILGVNDFLQNSKADFMFPSSASMDMLCIQIKDYFDHRHVMALHSDEIERAKVRQNERLPAPMDEDQFKVDIIYSPFNELSGDGLDYWCGTDKENLYGFLFDCTGHDIVSFTQTAEIRALLKRGCKYFKMGMEQYKTLSDVLKCMNDDLFDLYQEDVIPTAAVVFALDFKQKSLTYCSAAIPNFFIQYKDEMQMKEVIMENYPIGYEPGVEFDEKKISLENVEKVIFSSDGFSELLFENSNGLVKAKHDDVSAIVIQIKQSCP